MNDEVITEEELEAPAETQVEPTGPTPEEALAASREQLRRETEARQAAEARANQATGQAATASEIALNSEINSTDASLKTARAAYRAAREVGDIDAEMAATEEISRSSVRLNWLKGEQQKLVAQKSAPKPAPQQQASRIPGPAARAWMDDHPKISTDPAYANAAEAAHNRAIANGYEPESPGYFQSINSDLEKSFGANHGRNEMPPPRQQGQQPTTQNPRKQPPASSFATPQGRGNGAGNNVSDIASVAKALGHTVDTLKEAADICNMPLDKYVKAQQAILAERGESTITYGDGAVFR